MRATEVTNGIACDCICPGCRKPLNAANGGQKVIPHFRHVHAEDCVRGYKDGVCRAAVSLIAKHLSLTLPAYSKTISAPTASGRVLMREVGFPAKTITAEAVERFVDLGEVLAHAALTMDGRQLFVRIKVSSRSENERYQRLSSLASSSLEIDLSGLNLEQINDAAVFENAVFSDPGNREWIRSMRGERLVEHARQQLITKVQAENDRYELERARLQAIEAATQEVKSLQDQARAVALEAHRRAQHARAEEQRAAGYPPADDRGPREQREELIVRQTLRAAREWGGEASECSACFLLNPPGTQFCFFCSIDASPLSRVLVSADVASTMHFRMRSSAKPDRSLRMVPTFVVYPDPP